MLTSGAGGTKRTNEQTRSLWHLGTKICRKAITFRGGGRGGGQAETGPRTVQAISSLIFTLFSFRLVRGLREERARHRSQFAIAGQKRLRGVPATARNSVMELGAQKKRKKQRGSIDRIRIVQRPFRTHYVCASCEDR